MAADETEDDHVPALRLAREEGRRTLEEQLATLDDIDAKALAVFRLDIALVGVVLSGLSVAAASDVTAITAFFNLGTGVGLGLFVLSAVAAGLTYVTGGHHIGAGPAGIERAATVPEPAYLEWLVAGYADWIRVNERANHRKALLVTLAMVGAVGGTLALGVGVVSAITDRLLVPAVVAVVTLLLFGAIVELPAQFRRRLRGPSDVAVDATTQDFETPMTGQRAFRGRDRR